MSQRLFWRRLFPALALVLGAAGMAHTQVATNAAARSRDDLESFYIARFFFSDYLPGSSDQILDVTPQGDGVRVRVVHISQANDMCPGLLVRAVERVFPHTSVTKVAGRDLCSFNSDQVDGALKAAAPKVARDISDSATETIVAKCGSDEKRFDFPYPAEVDEKALKRKYPEVSRLWDTNYRVFERALRKNFSFASRTSPREEDMEALGTAVLPELKSGKYQAAYAGSKCGAEDCDNYLAWQLNDYKGATPPYDPGVVTLLNASLLRLTKYVEPIMPRIAETAHVYGDVQLRIYADPETGSVKTAEAVSGPQLLWRTALQAARSWQFAPETLTDRPIEVTLRFELRCR